MKTSEKKWGKPMGSYQKDCYKHDGNPRRRERQGCKHKDWRPIPGQGLLLTAERQIKGMWGRRLWWEMPVEESYHKSLKATEARRYCWVKSKGWTITIASLSPHTSIGSWTTERLAHQMPDALNYRVGPHPGCPFKCLMRRSTEYDPSQGGPF